MKQQIVEPPENTVFIGWVGKLCLKRFDVIPEQMGQDDEGTSLFLLAHEQSYSFLRAGSQSFKLNNERLITAAREKKKVTVTIDIATADIVDVSWRQNFHHSFPTV